ncbi:DUF6502 family protein [Hydrogenophaga sp.]|uniref:DUF6502 family protein n=1 Tax=Hydrogenophaga sp. TaxID=1904254 RepID=UPI0025C07588|nr:DUF6502 family protein [Hydrogenophaga sp.]
MHAPDHPLQTEQQALQQALQSVLTPLAQLCVARGLTIQSLEEQMRLAFVRVAHAEQCAAGRKPNTSHLSAATGLARREVARLLAHNTSELSPRPAPASQVFSRWTTDPTWCNEQQQPLVLPRQGSQPSFEALAQSVTRDVHPRTLLDELCRLHLARHDAASDTVQLQQQAFVPHGDWTRMVGFLGHNVGDHLRAASANVLGQGAPHFEQAIDADELSEQSIAALKPKIAQAWKQLLQLLVPEIEGLMKADRAAPHEARQRMRIGLYTWNTAMHEPAGHTAAAGKDHSY